MESAWEIEGFERYSKLKEDTEADVAIIGGGMAGMWAAYLLSKEGKKVVLIEKDRVGRGETLYTTAFITEEIDTDLVDLLDIFGKKDARLSWQAGREAIDLIESVIKEENIDCEFERGSLFVYAATPEEFKSLEAEDKLARSLGFQTKLQKDLDLGFEHDGAWEIEDQAKFHPMKFFKGLLEASIRNGATIHERTEADRILGKDPMKVVTKDGAKITARDIIIATYKPFNNPAPTHFKKGMYVSYVYELRIKPGSVRRGMFEDLENPYHYVRVDQLNHKYDRMIVGGEDHREELKLPPKKNFTALDEYIKETFPTLEYVIASKWSGKILEPSDGLPLIGPVEPHIYVASAFSGNGMTYSAISGRILTDLIQGKPNVYTSLYDPQRSLSPKALLKKAKDYGGEFLGGAAKNIFK
ncbi:MAG: dependent oxidoreductase [Parcubacteria group bacterium]|nr:dependent oxidoreductase [Parcubacteria group bacterium]